MTYAAFYSHAEQSGRLSTNRSAIFTTVSAGCHGCGGDAYGLSLPSTASLQTASGMTYSADTRAARDSGLPDDETASMHGQWIRCCELLHLQPRRIPPFVTIYSIMQLMHGPMWSMHPFVTSVGNGCFYALNGFLSLSTAFTMASMAPSLVLGTHNPGKVAELRALLDGLPLTLRSLADWSNAPDVVEDADSLQGNALKKANALHAHTNLPTLSDDTGLEVEALGGKPGVHTARFAGPKATDEENIAHLLEALSGADTRRAQFRTVIAIVTPTETRYVEGVCPGTIAMEPRGHGGFGYDPVFIPREHTQTFAEMDASTKNRISHRRRALDALHAVLKQDFDVLFDTGS